jgi:hypothetical protein
MKEKIGSGGEFFESGTEKESENQPKRFGRKLNGKRDQE